jgi:hypothetical protein
MSNMVQQRQSPLFQLPVEIRMQILQYVFSDSTRMPRDDRYDEFYFGPDQMDWRTNHTAALRTCKRIFHENRLSPVSLVEHTFWLNLGPYCEFTNSGGAAGQWRNWQMSLNPSQRKAVQQVRLYTQARNVHELDLEMDLHSKQVTLVIREMSRLTSPPCMFPPCAVFAFCPWLTGAVSTDVMVQQPLRPDQPFFRARMNRQCWGGQLCLVEGLIVLKIQFEVHESRKEELELVLQRASFWQFPIPGDCEVLIHERTRRWSWKGNAEPKADGCASLSTYLVSEMTWRRRKGDLIS